MAYRPTLAEQYGSVGIHVPGLLNGPEDEFDLNRQLQNPGLNSVTPPMPLPSRGELKNYTPPVNEQLANIFNTNLYDDTREGQHKAQHLANWALRSNPLGWAAEGSYDVNRGVGGLLTGETTPHDLQLQIAEAAIPDAKGAKGAVQAVERGAESAVKKAAVGKMLTLRDMKPAEALAAAKTEPHLVQDKTGQYIGAPRGITNRQQLEEMRANFDRLVDAGAEGGDWYTRAGEWINRMTGGDPKKVNRLSNELAYTSARVDPNRNLGFTLQSHNAMALAGKSPPIVRTGAQAREMEESYLQGRPSSLGKKTSIYEQHINPLKQGGPTGTNDIWHARAFGYTGGKRGPDEELDRALSDQEHAFLDYETVLAADRANQRAAGGRTNWTGGEVQAAPWVAAKGAGLAKRYPKRFPDAAAGRGEASKTYPDYASRYAVNATHEAIPGRGAGHLEGLLDMPFSERQAFSADPRSNWRTPTGNDVLYSAADLYNEPTAAATGYFKPAGGGVEINPAAVARPLAAAARDELGRTVHPRDQAALNAVEGFRAFGDVQNMGAWHTTFGDALVSSKGAVHFPLDRSLAPDEMSAIADIAGEHGLVAADTGSGLNLLDFSDDASGKKARVTLDAIEPRLHNLIGASKGEIRRPITGSVDYEAEWQTPGKGAVTSKMLSQFDQGQIPLLEQSLSDSPQVRQHMLDLNARDMEVSQRTGMPVRQDVLYARNVIASGGLPALRKELKLHPELLPAVAALLGGASQMPGLLGDQQSLPAVR